MTAALLALGAAGLAPLAWPARVRAALVWGGTAVTVLQVVPVLHVVTGLVALAAWEWLSGEGVGGGLSEAGGFFVTLATGQPLAALALLIGYTSIGLGWVSVPGPPIADDQRE